MQELSNTSELQDDGFITTGQFSSGMHQCKAYGVIDALRGMNDQVRHYEEKRYSQNALNGNDEMVDAESIRDAIRFEYCLASSSGWTNIRCAPFEALYGRKCRSLVLWAEIGESSLIGPELLQEDGLIKWCFDKREAQSGERPSKELC
ncbi:hypothetical protein Tco_0543153 [Tanacetum coccineum]